jgi:C-terminal processing protease CtpA/Prc
MLLVLGSCAAVATDDTTCGVTDQNTQIVSIMQSWYYWYANLPATIDPSSYTSQDDLLDAIREQPLDRFTYITTQAADQAFYGAGQFVGYGFGYNLSLGNNILLTQVIAGSPAALAGLARGDTVTAVNGTPVPTLVTNQQLDASLSVSDVGQTVSLQYVDPGAVFHTVTLTSAVVTQPTVGLASVFGVSGQTVGYLLFNSFIDTSTAQLDQAFAQFASEGVTELVIDERYNGGGEVTVAQHLAALIAGNSYSGRPLGTLTYNDKHSDQNATLPFPSVASPLNLTRVVFITSGATASAAEFTINALVPYLQVVTVGSATFGKPVGEDPFNVCTNVLYPITFKITNASGYGDYFDGLPATCAATDDLSHALGDSGEASLATALNYLATGNCGAGSAAAAKENARRETLRPRRAARYGFRQLVGAY